MPWSSVVHCVTLLVRHDTANTLVIVRMYFSRPVGRHSLTSLDSSSDVISAHFIFYTVSFHDVFTTFTAVVCSSWPPSHGIAVLPGCCKFGGQAASTLVTICPFKLSSIVLCTGHDICRRGPLTRLAPDHLMLIACPFLRVGHVPTRIHAVSNLCMFFFLL